jgi:probable HAF family extracellular repeat protein
MPKFRPVPIGLLVLSAGITLNACTDRGGSSGPTAPSARARLSSEESVAQPAVNTYTTIDVPGGSPFQGALDINGKGVIVGRYLSGGNTYGYVRSETGQFTTIQYPSAVFTVAAGLNDRGDIVGHYSLPSPPKVPPVRHGYLLRNGVFTSFDPPDSKRTNVLGINDRGDITGRFLGSDGKTHGFLLSEGVFTTIDYPGSIETNLWKINPRGQIVGGFRTPDGKSHVFVFRDGNFTAIDLPGVADITEDNGSINSRGDIVGVYCDITPCVLAPTGNHGFLLSDGDLTTIDIPGSPATVAFGINKHRDIVGGYYDANGLTTHGFLIEGRERADDHE